tara:strand:- start:8492 stop:9175 length:684 start_codon:yes stop_codon:yes gene_type:complete
MVNYSKSIIYKIVPKDINLDYVYIGSTCDFKSRKSKHKGSCNNPNSKQYNYKIYQHIRDNGGWDEFEMILIEYYPCNTKLELIKRERECKIEYNDNMGMSIPGRTRKEYYDDNKESILQKQKQYREDNKESIEQKRKEYRKNNKESIAQQKKEYYDDNKDILLQKKKEYYDDNKESIAQQQKEYYEDNKESILQKGKEKIECPICNCMITKHVIQRHNRTKKHINNL